MATKPEPRPPMRNQVGLRMDEPIPGSADDSPGVMPKGKPETTFTMRWEYMTLDMESNAAANLLALNRMGSVGWELVQVMQLSYVLKRRVQ